MITNNGNLPGISVVFVTYRRLETLRPTLDTFLRTTDYPRELLELIVTDDGSPPAVTTALRSMGFDRVMTSDRRTGLGANVNRGLDACTHDLIVQLQDDWKCEGPPSYLREAVEMLDRHPTVGLLSFNRLPRDHLPSRREDRLRIFDNQPALVPSRVEDAAYSDWPQIKRRDFVDDIGCYKEGVFMAVMELDYGRAINSQRRWLVADVPEWTVFSHIGEALSFNRTWKSRLVGVFRALPGGKALHDRYDNWRRPKSGTDK